MKPSPECPINVELDILAANNDKPTIGQDILFPARKYDSESEDFLFRKAHPIIPITNKTIIVISIADTVPSILLTILFHKINQFAQFTCSHTTPLVRGSIIHI